MLRSPLLLTAALAVVLLAGDQAQAQRYLSLRPRVTFELRPRVTFELREFRQPRVIEFDRPQVIYYAIQPSFASFAPQQSYGYQPPLYYPQNYGPASYSQPRYGVSSYGAGGFNSASFQANFTSGRGACPT
jgi:hypothetical protein